MHLTGYRLIAKYIFQNANSEVKMDNLFKSLDYYSIEDGDEIIVKW